MARKRRARYGDSRRYYDWLDRAGEDLQCAMLLLRVDDCYSCIAFHSQQSIEKALKAYILAKSDRLVDGHNLTWLCKQAMKYDDGFAEWLDESASLNKCYIETRYPADISLELTHTKVSGYYEMAKKMYAFICQELDKMLDLNRVHPGQRAYNG